MAGIFDEIRTVLYPSKWDSWQALIWVSVFSWAVSLLSAGLVQEIIATVAWVFLTLGVHWFVHEEGLFTRPKDDKSKINIKKGLTINNIFLGPWITGALICVYLFGHLMGRFPPLAFVVWPPLSAAIAAIPKFIKLGPAGTPIWVTPEAKFRLGLIILVLSNLLLSCWFQFYFSTQTWVQEYPSLANQDLKRSSFMVKVGAPPAAPERGRLLLEQAEASLQSALGPLTWIETQRWFQDFPQAFRLFREALQQQGGDSQEKRMWALDGRILPDYSVQLYAIWQGPSAELGGYHFTRTCKVRRLPGATLNAPKARIECGPIVGPVPGLPDKTK